MNELWIVSNVPPPVHGVSAFNAALLRRLEQRGVPARLFRVGTRGALTDVERVSAGKLAADAGTVARLALAAARRGATRPVIYFTPSQGGAAVLRDVAVARVARLAGIPLVAHVHGCGWLDARARGGWQAPLMLDALRGCATVICLGESYARRMRDATGLRCVGVNNGVAAPVGVGVKVVSAKVELLYLSNLIRSKGLWTAALALRELRARGVAARLRCAGAWSRDDERVDFMRDFAAELAAGTVELVGFAEEEAKARLLAEAHVFVLPTEYPPEGQPLSLIEAMAAGVVPVTTTQGGIPDLLGEGFEELASPAHRDAGAVADTIVGLVSDGERYRRTSARVLERYRHALTLDRCLDAVLKIVLSPPKAS